MPNSSSSRAPFEDDCLTDGTLVSVQGQATFRTAARLAHTIGLTLAHGDGRDFGQQTLVPGNADGLEAILNAGIGYLKQTLPECAAVMGEALGNYLAEGHRHPDPELCHFCTDMTGAALSDQYGQSGLSADLVTVLELGRTGRAQRGND